MVSYLLILALVAFCSGGANRASAESWGCQFIGSDAEHLGEALAPAAAVPRKDEAEAARVAWLPLQISTPSDPVVYPPGMVVERVALRGIERLRLWRYSAGPGRGPPQVG